MFRTSFRLATILLLCLTYALGGAPNISFAGEGSGEEAQPEAPKDRPCPDCHGKGGTKTNCKECNGSGMCPSCQGKGERSTAASKAPVTCLKCKGSGLCKACNGSGGPTTKCTRCGGTGRIPLAQQPEAPREEVKQPAAPPKESAPEEGSAESEKPPPREERPPHHQPPPHKNWDSMSSYMDVMHQLQQQYDDKKYKAVGLGDILSNPGDHVGELIQSDVYVLGGNPRGIIAGTSEYPSNKEMVKLTPNSREVGNVIWVFMEKATGARKARIIYGVQSADNFVLFNIAEPPK